MVDVVGLDSGVTAVSSGMSFTCAVQRGAAKCWGWNDVGQLGDGTNTNRSVPVDVVGLDSGVTAISAGNFSACAVQRGAAKCWGFGGNGALGHGQFGGSSSPVDVVGLQSGVTVISAGGNHACAVQSGGAKCWGWNQFGELGDGTIVPRPIAVGVVGLQSGVTVITAGGSHTCALTSAGGAKCWGSTGFGELGDGTHSYDRYWRTRVGEVPFRSVPVDVVGLTSGVRAISAAERGASNCAVTSAGGVKCWGANYFGGLGDGTTTDRAVAVDVAGLASGVTSVDAGSSIGCAVVSGGGVKCWGKNNHSQLGDGTSPGIAVPVDVVGLPGGVSTVALNVQHACAVTSGGGVKCWGSGHVGVLGNGTDPQPECCNPTSSSVPVDVEGLTSGVTVISAGGGHNCALTSVGGVKCWGGNRLGQLGDGTTEDRMRPVDVVGLDRGVTAIAAGNRHTCALTSAGGVKCWGANDNGSSGSRPPDVVPVDVEGLTSGVTAISAGAFHTCALTSQGGVKCWGSGTWGELGNGTTRSSSTPVDVVGLDRGVTAIAAGYARTCALTSVGGVKCWGWGPVGDGTTEARQTPVDVVGLDRGVTAIAAGGSNACALTSRGAVLCWGANYYGQLGDGTGEDRLTPVKVAGLNHGVTAIAAGFYNTCAIQKRGGVQCWGDNFMGQVGSGTPTWKPVDVLGFGPA